MNPARLGLASATGAYLIWGLLPVFWKQLQHISPFTVAAHRILWAAIVVTAWLLLTGKGGALARAFTDRRQLQANTLAALAIGANFFIFIWAVSNDRVTEVSLGYYINPLLNVFLGYLFLREALRTPQWLAVGLAAAGVLVLVVLQGSVPWVALALAVCFGTYGLIRKMAPAEAMVGLAAETLLLAPLCLIWLLGFTEAPLQVFADDALLLVLTGPVTALPLLLFALGARRLPYSTIGMLMYIAPTIQLMLAVWTYGEPFTAARAAAFGCIWVAIGLFVGTRRRSPA